jgi:hypothetical protein
MSDFEIEMSDLVFDYKPNVRLHLMAPKQSDPKYGMGPMAFISLKRPLCLQLACVRLAGAQWFELRGVQ